MCLALCALAVYAVPVTVKNVTSLNQVEDPEKVSITISGIDLETVAKRHET